MGLDNAGITSGGSSSGMRSSGVRSESSSSLSSGGPATLRLKAPPKTMKFIPGKLVVSAGPDQGTEFRIAGHPTPEGNVVTIGRAKVEGERAFAHIQLGEAYRTVSRIQAEIVQQEDSDVLLRNKSTTNPTLVNNESLPPEETVVLTDGDLIQMGELVLRYEV
jgi:pSer/pThr/pTyr-binding forkhead associated (FHA) protein